MEERAHFFVRFDRNKFQRGRSVLLAEGRSFCIMGRDHDRRGERVSSTEGLQSADVQVSIWERDGRDRDDGTYQDGLQQDGAFAPVYRWADGDHARRKGG